MKLKLKGFSQLIQDMGAVLQSSATSLVDVSLGSVIRAIFEANASVVLWLQWLILQVLQMTRASTSQGPDLDSWMLDFGQTRLPPVVSTGMVTFSRFAANLPASVPAGTTIKTADGLTSFSVTKDPSLLIWRASTSSYVLPSGVTSTDLPVACNAGGSVGNVLANTVNIIATSLPGIDQVNNANALSNGADPESDNAFRNRFQNYLASLSRATRTAVLNAITNVRQGLEVVVVENTTASGATHIGSFMVIVDDGTGFPPSDLLSSVASAVEFVRPIGTTFAVLPPQVVVVDVSLTATLRSDGDSSAYVADIQNYVSTYLNSLPIGRGASVTRVAQNAYLAGSGVENVSGILLNGGASDIVPAPLAVIKAGHVLVVASNDG